MLQPWEYSKANTIRAYIRDNKQDMCTADLIGAYNLLIDSGDATDAEECELLDLLNPFVV